jgi:hypothetical protein
LFEKFFAVFESRPVSGMNLHCCCGLNMCVFVRGKASTPLKNNSDDSVSSFQHRICMTQYKERDATFPENILPSQRCDDILLRRDSLVSTAMVCRTYRGTPRK